MGAEVSRRQFLAGVAAAWAATNLTGHSPGHLPPYDPLTELGSDARTRPRLDPALEALLAPQCVPQNEDQRAARILALLGLHSDTPPSPALNQLTSQLGVPRLEKATLASELSQLQQANRFVRTVAVQGVLLALRTGKRHEALRIVEGALTEDCARLDEVRDRLRLAAEPPRSLFRRVSRRTVPGEWAVFVEADTAVRFTHLGAAHPGAAHIEGHGQESKGAPRQVGVLDTAGGSVAFALLAGRYGEILAYRLPGDEMLTRCALSRAAGDEALATRVLRTLLRDSRVVALDPSFRATLSADEYRAASYLRVALQRDSIFEKLEMLIERVAAPPEFDKTDLRPLYAELSGDDHSI